MATKYMETIHVEAMILLSTCIDGYCCAAVEFAATSRSDTILSTLKYETTKDASYRTHFVAWGSVAIRSGATEANQNNNFYFPAHMYGESIVIFKTKC